MTAAVQVNNLVKRYGEMNAVDGISFEVPPGQLLAVLGPNGAGKTTTLEILEGFSAPTSGTVRVLGTDPRHGNRAWRARIGLVLQDTSLDAGMPVRAVLSLFGQLYPNARPVDEVLDIVDLADDAATKIGTLSGGQRRRVDIAIGVIGRPEVLFLDEPTTGLDPEARRRTWAAVDSLTSSGTTVLLTTHYIEEADQLSDRMIVLSGGKIVADTTPHELRMRSGLTTVRYPLPAAARATLPASLSEHVDTDTGALVLHTSDVTTTLAELTRWASSQRLDLAGLEVGPPTLEDAYLTVTGQDLVPHVETAS